MFDDKIINSINQCVLCWLATASSENIPNVSPKEIFTHYGNNKILIANIASPQSVKNIKQNKNVAVSFVDVFVQKGYQLKGQAVLIEKDNADFNSKHLILKKMAGPDYPILSVIEITVLKIKTILAPRYVLFPETSEAEQIMTAKKTYGCLDPA